MNLGLSNICFIIFYGIGGWIVDKMIKYDFDKICSVVFNIVVFELGLNDLCDKDSDFEIIVFLIVVLVELLFIELSLWFIVVCEVIVC